MQGSDFLELRLFRRREGEGIISAEELQARLRETFYLTFITERLFRAVLVSDLGGFRRSESSGKVIRFIDQRSKRLQKL